MSLPGPEGGSKEAEGAERTEKARELAEGPGREAAEALYRERLAQIWSAALGDDTERAGEFDRFVTAMTDVGAAIPVSEAPQAAGLAGDATTVRVLVSDAVRGADSSTIEQFMRDVLAPTIDRLEREGRVTAEERSDIVGSTLFPLRRDPAAGTLALAVVRHLHTQPPDQRGAGWFATVANMGGVVTGVRDRDRSEAGVAVYHLVLSGLRQTAESSSEFLTGGNARLAVNNSAFNGAAAMADMLQRERLGHSNPAAMRVLRQLKVISGATVRDQGVDRAVGLAVLEALALPADDPVAAITALVDMGAVAGAWQADLTGQARLEAASGTADAATADPRDAAGRLFNAGVSLGRREDRRSPEVVLRRMLLNVLGLRLSLGRSEDVVTDLVEFSGLDCAVNLVAAYNEYRGFEGRPNDAVHDLVRRLVALGSWPPLAGRAPAVDLARLRNVGTEIGISAARTAEAPQLPGPVQSAIDALRVMLDLPAAVEAPVFDTARIVGAMFGGSFEAPSGDGEPLERQVAEVVRFRGDPVRALLIQYEPLAPNAADPIGSGPLVPAGLMARAEWDSLVGRVTAPLASVAPLLRNFVLAIPR